MALSIWLPLINDLHSQGLDNIQVACDGTQKYSSGLLGTAISLNTQTIVTSNINKNNTIKSFSFGGWVNSADSVGIALKTNYGTCTINLVSGQISFIHDYTGSTIATTVSDSDGVNAWHHLFVEYDNNKFTIFINGIETQVIPIDVDIEFTEYNLLTTSIGQAQLNDVRMYDTAVGNKYINILSMGLYTRYMLSSSISALSSTMMIDDCSGYKHNGILYNPSYISITSSARGKMAYILNSTHKLTYIQVNEDDNLLPYGRDQFTISVWYNSTLDPQGDILNVLDGQIRITEDGAIINQVTTCFDNYENQNNTWALLTIVFNKGYISLYRNGELTKQFNCVDEFMQMNNEPTKSYIGAYVQGDNIIGYKGSLSDMRIYTTILSDTQIKELYCSPIHVTNKGSLLLAGEVIESWE